MKKFIYLFTIILLAIGANSCKDIIDSDDNILKEKIDYNFVLNDQKNSVIMPLQPGYKWFYKVRENGKEYLDSIEVVAETEINGEKWFEVRFPMFNGENVYMTNTDMGLWLKCGVCENDSYLIAQYPLKDKKYFAGSFETLIRYDDGNGNDVFEKDTMFKWGEYTEFGDKTVYGGTYNCIKYDKWFESKHDPSRKTAKYIEYYSVDLGPVYSEITTIDQQGIYKSYELLGTNFKNKDKLQNVYEIDFGIIPIGSSKELQVANFFLNESQQSVNINSINLNLNLTPVILISPTMFPITIAPIESLTLRLKCTPTAIGSYSGIMTVNTSIGSYDVIVRWVCE